MGRTQEAASGRRLLDVASYVSTGRFPSAGDPFCAPPLRFATACLSRYSIWPFTLRNSSCAQASRSAQSAGSIRNRNDFRSAIVTLVVQRPRIDHRTHLSFAAEHDHQIADHVRLALVAKLDDLLLR